MTENVTVPVYWLDMSGELSAVWYNVQLQKKIVPLGIAFDEVAWVG